MFASPALILEKWILKRSLFATLLVFLFGCLPLASYAEKLARFSDETEVKDFIDFMHKVHGFDKAYLARHFAAIRPNATVLRAIRPAAVPEQQRSWQRYRERFVNLRRTEGGIRFWQENEAVLRRAEAIYGVPAEIMVAIIGVETEYGRNMGSFKVLEALASLAFHYPPRAEFFRGELEQFLLLARENTLSPLEIKGSYAGAIGIPQFMPSSQRHFAVDFDADKRIDLRHSISDAIGSVARFLQQHGWQSGEPVAVPARVEPGTRVVTGIKPEATLQELAERGVFATGNPLRLAALVDLVTPDAATEYWAGFENFYVITRYNRSSFYAMSVFLLAQALREQRAAH
jgi:membrane-bound lytic murein transglycosylase B